MSDEEILKHPSYGYIRASRVSGSAALFDSAIRHQHYVSVEIGRAEKVTRDGTSHVFGGINTHIRVAMSEAQFAQFITSMNVGSGSPCTVERIGNQRVEEPPDEANPLERHREGVRKRADGLLESLAKSIETLGALVAKGKAGKAELVAALGHAEHAKTELTSNLPFFMELFQEQMEGIVQKAKIDINAHAVMLGQRLAIQEPTQAMIGPGDDRSE